MIDIAKIHEAIDIFINSNPVEDYRVLIDKDNSPRNYLGLSGIGDDCKRAVWYDFRKVATKEFPPRMKRLFRRGDREEFVFVWLLRGIGFTIHEVDEEGKQFKVKDFEGHLSGSCDGFGEAPEEFFISDPQAFVVEFKSYNDKRFDTLIKEGVAVSDPKYYTQLQGYMGYFELDGALFCAVNKNDDRLWFEWVEFDKFAFKRIVNLAEHILSSQEPPERISNNPSWWKCKNSKFQCSFYEICHEGVASLKSCKSCKFAVPVENAGWSCEKGKEYGTVCNLYRDIAK